MRDFERLFEEGRRERASYPYPPYEDTLDAALVADAETQHQAGQVAAAGPSWNAPRGCCPGGVRRGRR